MFINFALRNIFRQKRRSFLTGLSISAGYVFFALTLSLIEGSYSNMIKLFTENHIGHIQIHSDDYLTRPKIYKSINDRSEIEHKLINDPRIISFTPRTYSPALSFSEEKTGPVQLIGIDPEKEPTVSRLREKITEGSFFNESQETGDKIHALISKGLAIKLGLEVNDEFVLIGQGADGSIANDIFTVSGTVGRKSSLDKTSVYLPLTAMQDFLSLDNNVHEYALLIRDVSQAQMVSKSLQSVLSDFVVSPWQVVEEVFFKSMEADKRGNWVFLGLVTIIVFIGVLNTIFMSVLERTREFGVMRAIGFRAAGLINLIFTETILLTLLSLFLGLLTALPLILWFSEVGYMFPEPMDMGGIEFQHLKGDLSLKVLFLPMGIVFLFATFTSALPAIRASRLTPVDALGRF